MSTPFQRLRGWVDLVPDRGDGSVAVYEWNESHDCGQCVGEFATRKEALAFAVNWAIANGRKLHTPEVAHFSEAEIGGAE